MKKNNGVLEEVGQLFKKEIGEMFI